MTEIVFKPEPGAKIVSGKGLYRAFQNKKPLDLTCRAKNASEADAMLQYLFENQTAGKTLDFDLKGLIECKEESNEDGQSEKGGEPEKPEDPEGH